MPAVYAPTPTPKNMKPNCETVEYAKTFLMSCCLKATVAAKSAVSTPIPATTALLSGASANSTEDRTTR